MILSVTGQKGNSAQVLIMAKPDSGITIIKGKGEDATIFKQSSQRQIIGSFPTNCEFQILFYRRPWEISIEAYAISDKKIISQASLKTTSDREELPEQTIVTPDSLIIDVNFNIIDANSNEENS